MFITGQKVVCIDGNFPLGIAKFYTALPREGKVYVVRGMAPGIAITGEEGEIAVYLIGLNNPCSNKAPFRERGFRCDRFRPLKELTEDELAGKTNEDFVEVPK